MARDNWRGRAHPSAMQLNLVDWSEDPNLPTNSGNCGGISANGCFVSVVRPAWQSWCSLLERFFAWTFVFMLHISQLVHWWDRIRILWGSCNNCTIEFKNKKRTHISYPNSRNGVQWNFFKCNHQSTIPVRYNDLYACASGFKSSYKFMQIPHTSMGNDPYTMRQQVLRCRGGFWPNPR